MSQLCPKKNPDTAKKLLETPDEKLSNDERQKKFILAIAMKPMPCPMCFEKVSIIDTAVDTLEISGDGYSGKYICPNCKTELAKVRPFFMVLGTPGWRWEQKSPIGGKNKDNNEHYFSLHEIEVLDAEHDMVTLLVERARRWIDPWARVVPEQLQLVTSARLGAYLQTRGWMIDGGRQATTCTERGGDRTVGAATRTPRAMRKSWPGMSNR